MLDELHAASVLRSAATERSSTFVHEIVDWVARAHRLIPSADRRIVLDPLRLVVRFAKYALHRARGRADRTEADINARDPELVSLVCDLFRFLGDHYFRLRIEGIENVPAHGPVLLVGNHSGGLLPSEGFFTTLAIHDHFGPARAVHPLAHDFLFDDPTLRRYAGRLGALRAGHASAHLAFAAADCVLVYPGSDLDTFRPFRDRNRVVLGGRTGFIKLALRERVPIVPIVTAGTHEQLIVLSRGDRLAKLLHTHAWARTEVLPLVLAIPWGLTIGFVPYLPLPAQTTQAFLPPMRWPDRDPDDPADIDLCYDEVEIAMQSEMDRVTAGRRFLLGAPARPSNHERR